VAVLHRSGAVGPKSLRPRPNAVRPYNGGINPPLPSGRNSRPWGIRKASQAHSFQSLPPLAGIKIVNHPLGARGILPVQEHGHDLSQCPRPEWPSHNRHLRSDTTHCRHRHLKSRYDLAYLSRLFAGIAIKTSKWSGRLVRTFCRNWGLTTRMMRLEDYRGLGFLGTDARSISSQWVRKFCPVALQTY